MGLLHVGVGQEGEAAVVALASILDAEKAEVHAVAVNGGRRRRLVSSSSSPPPSPDAALEAMRKSVEAIDYLEGTSVAHELEDGFAARLLEAVRDAYPRPQLLSVTSGAGLAQGSALDSYGRLFGLAAVQANADASVLLDGALSGGAAAKELAGLLAPRCVQGGGGGRCWATFDACRFVRSVCPLPECKLLRLRGCEPPRGSPGISWSALSAHLVRGRASSGSTAAPGGSAAVRRARKQCLALQLVVRGDAAPAAAAATRRRRPRGQRATPTAFAAPGVEGERLSPGSFAAEAGEVAVRLRSALCPVRWNPAPLDVLRSTGRALPSQGVERSLTLAANRLDAVDVFWDCLRRSELSYRSGAFVHWYGADAAGAFEGAFDAHAASIESYLRLAAP